MTNIKEILDCWEHCAHKVDINQLVQAIKEASEVIEMVAERANTNNYSYEHVLAEQWLKKWCGKKEIE